MLRNVLSPAIAAFQTQPLPQAALLLWQTLGYHSDLRLEGLPTDATGFVREFGIESSFRPGRAFTNEWKSVHFLFQVTAEEITAENSLFQGGLDKARRRATMGFHPKSRSGQWFPTIFFGAVNAHLI